MASSMHMPVSAGFLQYRRTLEISAAAYIFAVTFTFISEPLVAGVTFS